MSMSAKQKKHWSFYKKEYQKPAPVTELRCNLLPFEMWQAVLRHVV